jgi:hypothetical protein
MEGQLRNLGHSGIVLRGSGHYTLEQSVFTA